MSEYQAVMESLLARSVVNLLQIYVPMLLIIAVIWIVPWSAQKAKRKKKLKKKDIEAAKKSRLAQIALTVMILSLSLLTIPEISNIQAMKKDIDTQSYVVYTGSYEIADDTLQKALVSDLWLDIRTVHAQSTDEWLYLDMVSVWEGWSSDFGTYSGRIVYGENSKYIVKIQG